jgi:hypothetical protein
MACLCQQGVSNKRAPYMTVLTQSATQAAHTCAMSHLTPRWDSSHIGRPAGGPPWC